MFNEPGGYFANVNRGILPGFQEFTPPNAYFGPAYNYRGQSEATAAQERLGNRTLDSRNQMLSSFLPAFQQLLGSFGGGGGGGNYQTDYGGGLGQQPQQGQQQQAFRQYVPQYGQQQGGQGGGDIMGLMRLLSQFGGR